MLFISPWNTFMLKDKRPALRGENPSLKNTKFLFFFLAFPDPDPQTRLIPDYILIRIADFNRPIFTGLPRWLRLSSSKFSTLSRNWKLFVKNWRHPRRGIRRSGSTPSLPPRSCNISGPTPSHPLAHNLRHWSANWRRKICALPSWRLLWRPWRKAWRRGQRRGTNWRYRVGTDIDIFRQTSFFVPIFRENT